MKDLAKLGLALQLLGAEGGCRRGAPGYTRYQTRPYLRRGAQERHGPALKDQDWHQQPLRADHSALVLPPAPKQLFEI